MDSADEPERPHIHEHGAFPSTSANSFRQQYMASAESTGPAAETSGTHPRPEVAPVAPSAAKTEHIPKHGPGFVASQDATAVPSPAEIQSETFPAPMEQSAAPMAEKEERSEIGQLMPIKTNASSKAADRPGLQGSASKRDVHDDLFRVLSRKKTNMTEADVAEQLEDQAEIEKLMSRMFGKDRQAHSEDEKTRHVGLVFRNLTVKGLGLGAALQPTVGEMFLGLPRLLKGLFSGGAKKGMGKPPLRTILNDFSGCVRPGEMVLVLGRPGSGCSTFLKVLANQRYGYEKIEGEVTYGGEDAKTMGKHYRGEILYNPEDDLHYATLSVKNTLSFALTTRTPGKESRNEGETRNQYVQEFLRVVSKLFWIEHTMNTKVGNEFVRGVSGGEKKRVSIAEAMITKASTQCWDNSTRGLDASTALEYVQSLRTLTNMAHISTCIALYQVSLSFNYPWFY